VSNSFLQNPIEPGTMLAGKYRVERILGQGGMGIVVEARHLALDERVALKFLLPEYATHPEASARFQREARAAAKIKSEHVARVSDVGTFEGNVPYMVMEYLDGQDLRSVLEQAGVLPMTEAVDYLIQACEAIAEAHSYGIVHRDLKPANLFLSKRANGTPQVKVLDFGISKMATGGIDNLTKTTAAMGSALYMSPEQMQATRGVDHRTDIYALGISLYELLAGKQPFVADTLPQLCAEVFTGQPTAIRTLRPDLPEAFALVLEKAYARDRAQRYQSVGEFVIALSPFALPRTATVIESVARLAGLELPVPGAPPPAYVPTPGGTQMMPSAPGVQGPLAISSPSSPGFRNSAPGFDPSLQQSANPVVSAVPAPARASSKGPIIAAAVVGALCVLGGTAFLATRGGAGARAAAGAQTATAAPPPADKPTADKPAADAPTAAASAQPSAEPGADASAVPTTTAAAPTAAPPRVPPLGGKTGGTAAKQPATKTPATPGKRPDVGF
jgi:serine/threonine-protein kinase